MRQFRINNIAHSLINGPGNRLVIWVQGCPFKCNGCFNQETHPYTGGKFISVSQLTNIINTDPNIEGVTFSGGEPLLFVKELTDVLQNIKDSLTRIVFTGFTLEEIIKDEGKKKVILLSDLTIAGRYNQTLSHPFLGKKFLFSSERISIDYFNPYKKVEYTIHNTHITKTGIF